MTKCIEQKRSGYMIVMRSESIKLHQTYSDEAFTESQSTYILQCFGNLLVY